MLLELVPPSGDAAAPSKSFRLLLAFPDLAHGYPHPATWATQLTSIFASGLDLPDNIHMLDRAVGLGTLLDDVRVELLRDNDGPAGNLGVRVHCRFFDSRVVEWCIPPTTTGDAEEESARLLRALERILQDVESLKLEDEKCKLAVEYEEEQRQAQLEQQQQQQRNRGHQHTQSLEPVSLGRKWGHKRQKSIIQSIVSAMGSIMPSQRSTHSRTNSGSAILSSSSTSSRYPADYPFPVSPSPSPPLSPSHSPTPSDPSRSGSPSPEISSTSSSSAHAPHTYTYGAHHHTPLLPNPWSPPTRQLPPTPTAPSSLVPTLPYQSSSSHHQAQMRELRARIRASLADVYRRFVLGALVFGFAKEAGLASDVDSEQRWTVDGDQILTPGGSPRGSSGSETLVGSVQSLSRITSPLAPTVSRDVSDGHPDMLRMCNPNMNPARASNHTPHTYSYHLWLLRSMLRNMEEEVREIVESVEASVREDLMRAAQEIEVDVVDVDMVIDTRTSWDSRSHQAYSRGPTSPTSPTWTIGSSTKGKVSFDSFRSGGSGGAGSAASEKAVTLSKKKSKGKLVKKRSVANLGSSEGEKEKDGKDTQRGLLGLGIGNWGRSKSLLNSAKSSPSSTDIAIEPSAPAVIEDSPNNAIKVNVLEAVAETEDTVGVAQNSVDDDIADMDNASSTSHTTRRESSNGCGSLESSIATVSTGLTTPAGSEALSRCGSIAEYEREDLELDVEEEDIGVASTSSDSHSNGSPSPRSSTDGEDSMRDSHHQSVYGNSSLSPSTGNLLDEPNPTSMTSSTSLLLPIDTTNANNSSDTLHLPPSSPQFSDWIPNASATTTANTSPNPDIDAPEFQLQIKMRLNLHPSYTRLKERVAKLRDKLVEAEEERKERREEELRYLDMLEVRSRRKAWSAGALRYHGGSEHSSSVSGDYTLLDLSVPFKSSSLAMSSWTSEDMDLEGWVYVAPPNPHPLFHAFGQKQAFPAMHDSSPEARRKGDGPGARMMRKVDMKMSMRSEMERERERRRVRQQQQEDMMDCDNAFNAHRFMDGREDVFAHDGVVEFCLDASWNSEATLDSDDSEGDELDIDFNDHESRVVYGHQRQQSKRSEFGWRPKRDDRRGGSVFEDDDDDEEEEEEDHEDLLHDISNLPPRPRVRPTKNHPPPARLHAVAEEEEILVDDGDDVDGPTSGGAATETETEGDTEGEGDEFEFDTLAVSRTPQMATTPLEGTATVEDEDDDFFTGAQDIADIVGHNDKHRQYPRHRRTSPPHASSLSAQPQPSRRSGLDLRPDDLGAIERHGVPGAGITIGSGTGLAVGEGLRTSSLEWEDGSDGVVRSEAGEEQDERRRLVSGRPRTPYPKDDDSDEEDKVEAEVPTPRKRVRNHRRQWQAMLSSGGIGNNNRSLQEAECDGFEIALEVEKPKPRFMPAVKKFMGGRSSSKPQATASSATEASDTTPITTKALYPSGKPRARTTSMYHRQPSPHSRAGLNANTEYEEDVLDLDGETVEDHPIRPTGLGLPLGIGFGYGSYSNTPKPDTTGINGLSETSLLCQPVRFTLPSDVTSAVESSITPGPSRLQTKNLVAAPPVFTPPVVASKMRKASNPIHVTLDLEVDSVVDYEPAGNGLDFSGRTTPNSVSSEWSSHCSASTCSSASLPMSPLSPPSPAVGVASSVASSCGGSPMIRGHCEELKDEHAQSPLPLVVGGTWENASSTSDGEEFTLAMDIPRRAAQHGHSNARKNFHLPSSLLLSKGGASGAAAPEEGVPVDAGFSEPTVSSRRRRKSVFADPDFFEPPAVFGVAEADLAPASQ